MSKLLKGKKVLLCFFGILLLVLTVLFFRPQSTGVDAISGASTREGDDIPYVPATYREEHVGLGFTVNEDMRAIRDGKVFVVSVDGLLCMGPASDKDIRRKDIILAINGISLVGATKQEFEVLSNLFTQKGTEVVLKLLRENALYSHVVTFTSVTIPASAFELYIC